MKVLYHGISVDSSQVPKHMRAELERDTLRLQSPRALPGVARLHCQSPQPIFTKANSAMAPTQTDPNLTLKQVAGLLGVSPDASIGAFTDALATLFDAADSAAPSNDPAAMRQRAQPRPGDEAEARRHGITTRELRVCREMGCRPEVYAQKKREIRGGK